MNRTREQLLCALQVLAEAQRAGALKSQQIEESVKQHIEADLATLQAARHPAPPAILTALGLPFNTSERAWRSAVRIQAAALRKTLMTILRVTRELRQEERKTQPHIESLKRAILGVSGIVVGPVFADIELLIRDLETRNRAMEQHLAGLEADSRSLRAIGADAVQPPGAINSDPRQQQNGFPDA